MDASELISQASRLVNGKGDPFDAGCREDEAQDMIAYCKHLRPNKPFCLIANWCWADLDIDPMVIERLNSVGVQPAFIYSSYIIEDEAKRWNAALSVKTGLLAEFHKNCIFETRNTFYILVGKGSRLTVSPAVYNNLFF
jgi:hypothetical protein